MWGCSRESAKPELHIFGNFCNGAINFAYIISEIRWRLAEIASKMTILYGNLNFLLSPTILLLLKIRRHKTSEEPPQRTSMKPHLPKDFAVVGNFWKIVVVMVVFRVVSIVRRHTGIILEGY